MVEKSTITSKLIKRAKRGDSDAVAELYSTYVQQIYRYVAYRVSDISDAEDITADVFVKMVEGLGTYKDTGAPFESWLYRIASARIIDMYRRNTRRPVQDLDETLTSNEPLPEQEIIVEAEHNELRQAISQLTETDQNILIMRFVERKSHQEVATLLNKSMTAVKSAQHRALVRLAELLGEEKTRHYFRGSHE